MLLKLYRFATQPLIVNLKHVKCILPKSNGEMQVHFNEGFYRSGYKIEFMDKIPEDNNTEDLTL